MEGENQAENGPSSLGEAKLRILVVVKNTRKFCTTSYKKTSNYFFRLLDDAKQDIGVLTCKTSVSQAKKVDILYFQKSFNL